LTLDEECVERQESKSNQDLAISNHIKDGMRFESV